ncbi:PREDICTED: NADH dehydrogenase [ubiquinone] 1 alpha subcomplex subunit 7-like [Amphimedon queenslandica]|uniref:NADH dehydrogenase [ubiquinone] 1 alpha subcomplex subunit 7 n=1 Tax=Amphimedon queenslandica TaxID=400682 RepID=A0A1X7VRS2_AMPQE|nr:PREDICTED: NADH dehydrogenase [ubiquinone] 1 alpha subcomplex subunit 7-like [Amphimedon queenslandica]|eukprot:XP_003382949.1 PREDICTED: NADH dehydrogenase [ubiquinone] 1 alpha subcomplex subunit 7-like [Amphimedon queenslandica]
MVARPPGTPGKIVSFIRDILVGRHIPASPWLRTTDRCATRSPPPPNLPGGEAHKLAFNYYYSRDRRRDVQPPIISSSSKLVADKSDIEAEASPLQMPPVPGKGHP